MIIHTPTNIALDNNGIYIRSLAEDWQYQWPLHTHRGVEIFYFIHGQANYIIGDAIYDLHPGDMLLFRGDVIHRVNPSKEVKYVRSYLNFIPSFLQEQFPTELLEKVMTLFDSPNGVRIHWLPEERDEISRYFTVLQDENQKEFFGYSFMLQTLLSQFLIVVYRKTKYLMELTPSMELSNSQLTVQRILQYVNQVYKENESLEHMAAQLHLSKYYMCHCFKEVTGYTINSYIMRKRIDEAKHLLFDDRDTVTEIGERLGFNSTIHFSRTFKKYAEMSPHIFRKNSRQQKRG